MTCVFARLTPPAKAAKHTSSCASSQDRIGSDDAPEQSSTNPVSGIQTAPKQTSIHPHYSIAGTLPEFCSGATGRLMASAAGGCGKPAACSPACCSELCLVEVEGARAGLTGAGLEAKGLGVGVLGGCTGAGLVVEWVRVLRCRAIAAGTGL